MNFEYFAGNLTDAPALRSKEGAATARVTFTLAISDGKDAKGKEKVHFLNFTAFGTFAENLLCLNKGTRLNIQARVDSYPKEVQIDGRDVTLTMTTFIAVDGGPSMKWATVKVERNEYIQKPAVESKKEEAANGASREAEESPVELKERKATSERHLERTRRNDDEDNETPRRSSRSSRQERDSNDEPRERTRRVRPSTED
jgi:single-stranded DNA-binding protein